MWFGGTRPVGRAACVDLVRDIGDYRAPVVLVPLLLLEAAALDDLPLETVQHVDDVVTAVLAVGRTGPLRRRLVDGQDASLQHPLRHVRLHDGHQELNQLNILFILFCLAFTLLTICCCLLCCCLTWSNCSHKASFSLKYSFFSFPWFMILGEIIHLAIHITLFLAQLAQFVHHDC